MQDFENEEVDKLSNLSTELEELETKLVGERSGELIEAHDELIAALKAAKMSHYRMGSALLKFRDELKAARIWTEALNRIAKAFGCDAVTLRRMMEHAEHADRVLPRIVTETMIASGIDRARLKNRPIIDALAKQPRPASVEQAKANLRTIQGDHVAAKTGTRRSSEDAEPEYREFTLRTIRILKARYGTHPDGDKRLEFIYLLEVLMSTFGVMPTEVNFYSRPDSVPKPIASHKEAA